MHLTDFQLGHYIQLLWGQGVVLPQQVQPAALLLVVADPHCFLHPVEVLAGG